MLCSSLVKVLCLTIPLVTVLSVGPSTILLAQTHSLITTLDRQIYWFSEKLFGGGECPTAQPNTSSIVAQALRASLHRRGKALQLSGSRPDMGDQVYAGK